jgi:hypothetical protein
MRSAYKQVFRVCKLCLFATFCVAAGLYTLFLLKRTCMDLIHVKSGYVMATTDGDKVTVKDPILYKELSLKGISIPQDKRNAYHEKKVVFMDDPLFPKAFRELYLKKDIDHAEFRWKKGEAP